MASVRCIDVQARPSAFLDVTSVTREEFQQLVPPFEAAFQAPMAAWRLDGHPGPPAGLPSLSTAPCQRPKPGCGLFSSP
jgi:hypothetical protein